MVGVFSVGPDHKAWPAGCTPQPPTLLMCLGGGGGTSTDVALGLGMPAFVIRPPLPQPYPGPGVGVEWWGGGFGGPQICLRPPTGLYVETSYELTTPSTRTTGLGETTALGRFFSVVTSHKRPSPGKPRHPSSHTHPQWLWGGVSGGIANTTPQGRPRVHDVPRHPLHRVPRPWGSFPTVIRTGTLYMVYLYRTIRVVPRPFGT